MYKSYLSFAQLREYLSMLSEKGLVEYEEGTQKFRTTEKGLRVLQIQNQINDEFVAIDEGRTRRLAIEN
jgi:predicted transcriptional regulator